MMTMMMTHFKNFLLLYLMVITVEVWGVNNRGNAPHSAGYGFTVSSTSSTSHQLVLPTYVW